MSLQNLKGPGRLRVKLLHPCHFRIADLLHWTASKGSQIVDGEGAAMDIEDSIGKTQPTLCNYFIHGACRRRQQPT